MRRAEVQGTELFITWIALIFIFIFILIITGGCAQKSPQDKDNPVIQEQMGRMEMARTALHILEMPTEKLLEASTAPIYADAEQQANLYALMLPFDTVGDFINQRGYQRSSVCAIEKLLNEHPDLNQKYVFELRDGLMYFGVQPREYLHEIPIINQQYVLLRIREKTQHNTKSGGDLC